MEGNPAFAGVDLPGNRPENTLVGVDIRSGGGKAMEAILGLDDAPSGSKLSSTQRAAKQKAKLQRGMVREASAAADAMMAINAVARKQAPGAHEGDKLIASSTIPHGLPIAKRVFYALDQTDKDTNNYVIQGKQVAIARVNLSSHVQPSITRLGFVGTAHVKVLSPVSCRDPSINLTSRARSELELYIIYIDPREQSTYY